MTFLIDAQLPPALVAWLHQQGHKAEHVDELGLRNAEDMEILATRFRYWCDHHHQRRRLCGAYDANNKWSVNRLATHWQLNQSSTPAVVTSAMGGDYTST